MPGVFRGGRKHGRGVKTWVWGDRYEGEFADDRQARHGSILGRALGFRGGPLRGRIRERQAHGYASISGERRRYAGRGRTTRGGRATR